MGRRRGVIAVALAGGLAFACGTPPPPESRSRSATMQVSIPIGVAGEAAATRPAFRTATGTLAAYDAAARRLTIQAATGASSYAVAADARAWFGTRRLPLARLSTHLGVQATVAYTETEGVRVTHTVRLAEAGRRSR